MRYGTIVHVRYVGRLRWLRRTMALIGGALTGTHLRRMQGPVGPMGRCNGASGGREGATPAMQHDLADLTARDYR